MRQRSNRQYPRTARLNELLREIIADALERIDDDRLQLLTVTGVDCESDMRRARVYYDSLQGVDGDEAVLEALAELRPRLQAAVNRESRLKRTPELVFAPDPAVRNAARLEEVLREIGPTGSASPAADPASEAASDTEPEAPPTPEPASAPERADEPASDSTAGQGSDADPPADG